MAKEILGKSPKVGALLEMIRKVSASKTNILIIGESGTGKELVARMIHDSGPMKGKTFVPVNCGAIPETLIESEMFGHKRGSFTGAVSDKEGLFEVADGGTLFLDEVGEIPLSMQVKLLRALQDRKVRRVGGTEDIKVDVRIIAATNRDLEAGVQAGTFREDLYYRLNVILIKTPPLRERAGDVRLLAETFLKRFSEKRGKAVQGFEPDAWAAIERHRWPGNVRELENVIERAVTLSSSELIPASVLPQAVLNGGGAQGALASSTPSSASGEGASGEIRLPAPDFSKGAIRLEDVLGEVEKRYLLAAIEASGGVKKKAADLLGITFRSIRYRLNKLGLDSED